MSSTFTHHFRWDSSVPNSVAIKGSFDNWQSPLELKKHPSGKFSAPIELQFGTKVTYKYVVDGVWRHNPNEPTETDSSGNINNVFQVPLAPSPNVDPATDSDQPALNPIKTMSSDALVDQPLEHSSPVQDITHDSKTQSDAESNPSADMSIAFPTTTSPDQVPELIQNPKPPKGTKRTTSLFSSATRFARPSHRTTSLFSSAPGTPTEKASPAGASVSNVVSALAGVAANAIPAAIYAVTGKDITKAKPEQDLPAVAEGSATSQAPDESVQHSSPKDPNNTTQDSSSSQQPIQATEPVTEPSQTVLQAPQVTPLPANDATQNPEPKDKALAGTPATHQALPEPTVSAVPMETTPAPAKVQPVQATNVSQPSVPAQPKAPTAPVQVEPVQPTNPSPKQTLPLNEPPTVPIVLTPPSAAPIVPTLETAPVEQPKQETSPKLSPEEPKETTKQSEPSTSQAIPIEPNDAKAKSSPSNQSADADTPARVSFTEERPSIISKPSATPKRTSILIPSTPASPSRGNEEATTVPAAAKNEQASIGTKSKRGEFYRKTSGWRYSVGSIRSRRTSGETERSAGANQNSSTPTGPNHSEQSSSPHPKRRSSIFQKIKSALSPHKHQNQSSTRAVSNGFSSSTNNSKKRNSFGRTTTMTQD